MSCDCTLGVDVCVVLYTGCRCMCCVVHPMYVYVWCCTPSVGVCAFLYILCVCVVKGIGSLVPYGYGLEQILCSHRTTWVPWRL